MELLFEALDLLGGLGCGLGDWERLTNPRLVGDDLERLSAYLANQEAVARIVLPRCELGVESLKNLRLGFASRARTVQDDGNIDRSVSGLLRAMRNAGHGLGSEPRTKKSLLALMEHRSDVPPQLPDLAWFHLMRMLCFGHWRRPED